MMIIIIIIMVLAAVDSIIVGIFIVANYECYHCCYTNCTRICKYVYSKTVFFASNSGDSRVTLQWARRDIRQACKVENVYEI
jgi:hypothetical protein